MWLQNYSDPNSLGSRLRRRRLEGFMAMVRAVCAARGACRILDLGGRASYWKAAAPELSRLPGVSLTLLNIENPEDEADLDLGLPVTSVVGDACDLPYADGAFDIVHSNSVIEHVGSWGKMTAFAAEARRVARGVFVQTPSYWFPVEPHFRFPGFSLLPRPWQIKVLMARRNGFYNKAGDVDAAMRAIEACQLLNRRQMQFLFPDATIRVERFVGLEKSLIACRSA